MALVGGLVATAVIVAGCSASRPERAPTGAPHTGATASAGRGDEVSIPESALLRSEDMNGSPVSSGDSVAPYLQPPRPCADTRYPSDALRIGVRSVTATFRRSSRVSDDSNDPVVVAYVALYRPGGAAQFLAEFRAAMYDHCKGSVGVGAEPQRWAFMGPVNPGLDTDTLWIDVVANEYADPGAGRATRTVRFGMQRVGNAVIVVADLGSQSRDGDIKLIANLLGAVTQRVGDAFGSG